MDVVPSLNETNEAGTRHTESMMDMGWHAMSAGGDLRSGKRSVRCLWTMLDFFLCSDGRGVARRTAGSHRQVGERRAGAPARH